MEAEGVIHQVPDDTAAGVVIITSEEVGSVCLRCNRRSWKWHLEMTITNFILTCPNHFRCWFQWFQNTCSLYALMWMFLIAQFHTVLHSSRVSIGSTPSEMQNALILNVHVTLHHDLTTMRSFSPDYVKSDIVLLRLLGHLAGYPCLSLSRSMAEVADDCTISD